MRIKQFPKSPKTAKQHVSPKKVYVTPVMGMLSAPSSYVEFDSLKYEVDMVLLKYGSFVVLLK